MKHFEVESIEQEMTRSNSTTMITSSSSWLEEDNFNFTTGAIAIATCSGSVSFLCSMITVYIILKSPKAVFHTPYHRIMLLLSTGDMITSLGVALTTLPMPKDVVYAFAQKSYGNVLTCSIQAMVVISGSAGTLLISSLLYIYYLCSLVFQMSDAKFRKYVETPFIMGSIGFLLYLLIAIVDFENMNPSPKAVWCSNEKYPFDCNTNLDDGEQECRGRDGVGDDYDKNTFSVIVLVFSILILVMFLIIFFFYRNERKLQKLALPDENENTTSADERIGSIIDELKEQRAETKRITQQSLLYITAFFTTWAFPMLYFYLHENHLIAALRLLLFPLQGLFNFMIFLYHKVDALHLKRKSNGDVEINNFDAIKTILLHPGKAYVESTVHISNLSNMIDEIIRHREELAQERFEEDDENQKHTNHEFSKSTTNEKEDSSISPSLANKYSDLSYDKGHSVSKISSKKWHKLALSQGESIGSSWESHDHKQYEFYQASPSSTRNQSDGSK